MARSVAYRSPGIDEDSKAIQSQTRRKRLARDGQPRKRRGHHVFHDKEGEVLRTLKHFVPGLPHAKWIEVTERGRGKGSYYIWLELPLNDEVEIILRSPEEKTQKAKSEIYGDEVVGLT